MDSFKLSVMYQTTMSGGGNSAKSQGPEAETGWGRKGGNSVKSQGPEAETLRGRKLIKY